MMKVSCVVVLGESDISCIREESISSAASFVSKRPNSGGVSSSLLEVGGVRDSVLEESIARDVRSAYLSNRSWVS